MRKINFTIGERVAVIEDNKIAYGVILKIFMEVRSPVFVVQFEDGNVAKVEIDNIAKVESKDQTEEPSKDQEIKDRVEKLEITITPDQFRDITTEIIGEECAKMGSCGLMVGMAMGIIMVKIHTALFTDGVENE